MYFLLALNTSLAAAAMARVTVQTAVAAAFLPREADSPELSFLTRIDAGDAGGSQEGSTPFGGQRLKEETVVHFHAVHVEILIRHIVQSQQLRLSALHCAVPCQLHFAGIQLLLAQVLSQSVPVTGFLFACKLPQCVVSDGGVVAGHTQGAAPLAGHAGEALPPGEVIHRHQIKTYPFPPW